jgi:hypothetical protein
MLYNITIHRILPDFYFIYKFLQKFNFFFQVINLKYHIQGMPINIILQVFI